MHPFVKLSIVAAVIVVAVRVALPPSPDAGSLATVNDIESISNAPADESVDQKALHLVFAAGNGYTIVQRNMKERSVTGKIVEWQHEVQEVDKRESGRYRIRTSGSDASLGAFVTINTRSSAEAAQVEGLEAGDVMRFKGRIGGITKRHVDIDSAILLDVPAY